MYSPEAPTTKRKKRSGKSTCQPVATIPRRDDEDEEGNPPQGPIGRIGAIRREVGPSGGGSTAERHNSREGPTANQAGKRKRWEGWEGPPNDVVYHGRLLLAAEPRTSRDYCTQTCLLGLKDGLALDKNCPNVDSHRTADCGKRYPIEANEFVPLVLEQLRENPYKGCKAVDWRSDSGKNGRIGYLFKLELAPYGYTFVAKGTESGYLYRLQHERSVYARLRSLQGFVVPAFLGIVSPSIGYRLPTAEVVHMMLMSWGGEVATRMGLPNLTEEVARSLNAVRREGVVHNDERAPNMLWNEERRCVMVIDFDCTDVLPPLTYKRVSSLLSTSGGEKRRGKRCRYGTAPVQIRPAA